MRCNKKESFEYILNEYNTLWKYYIVLLDERQKIFENYLKVIALPTTILTFLLNLEDNIFELSTTKAAIISVLLITICVLGNIYFRLMFKETINAQRYFKQIIRISNYMRTKALLKSVSCLAFDSRSVAINSKKDSIKDYKVLIILIINVVVMSITWGTVIMLISKIDVEFNGCFRSLFGYWDKILIIIGFVVITIYMRKQYVNLYRKNMRYNRVVPQKRPGRR